MDVIEKEILLHDVFNLEQVLPNGRPDLNSFMATDLFTCDVGFVAVNDICGESQFFYYLK